jgi:hypothetical protein
LLIECHAIAATDEIDNGDVVVVVDEESAIKKKS